ncbi:HTTM domain-containing protein [Paracrocinitomix mangrovi]|uniref:HTTM domain-containing protein n=1 Tax=Paracrocinitomix mangrovi TaxID=2862509 RepID=UPI001EDAF2BA|nr:HTTM domain-containing protein [Paracrocinitomix mangrovi]UKN02071.1 HTTM domain-containing protein [Paracrocinitomix mangrovi]
MMATNSAISSKISNAFRWNWHEQVSAAPLATYRIGFGILMVFSVLRFWANGWIESQYIEPTFHFSYYGFEWLPYPNEFGIYALFGLMLLGAILILLGLFYRAGAIIFFLSFTYVELLDKTNYLNHYYFVSLIALLLIFIPANRYFSLDAKLGFTDPNNQCSKWHIRILQFQIAVVYFFAGIAKLEPDWLLNAQPLKFWLHTAHHYEIVGPILKQDWIAYTFAWFGCIYDLTIVFFLAWNKTRKMAYMFVIIFHITTWILFPIGVFPWVMMTATLIFFSADFHQKIIDKLASILHYRHPNNVVKLISINVKKFSTALLALYVFIQLAAPFRYLFYDGNLFWTEQGFRFSWRVMLMEKAGYATFYIEDENAKLTVDNSDFLTPNQEKMMSTQPDMILQYAHHLEDVYQDTVVVKHGVEMEFNQPEIHAEVYVTLNSRPHQLYVDKKHNLATIENDLSQRNWLEEFID